MKMENSQNHRKTHGVKPKEHTLQKKKSHQQSPSLRARALNAYRSIAEGGREGEGIRSILQDVPFHKVAGHLVRRFGRERINPVHIGKALVYFADADPNYDSDFIGKKVSWEAIKDFFKRHVRQFTMDIDAAKEN
jgi:hypothetical protein